MRGKKSFLSSLTYTNQMKSRGDAEAWYNKGYALFERGEISEAIKALNVALGINPGDTKSWILVGNASMEMEDYETALKAYDEVLKKVQADADIWVSKGNALFNLGRTQEALSAFQQALNIEPDHYYAEYCRNIAHGLVTSPSP
nr:tetratricopeptide repeat protein [uncultured Methanospirillum sp.]